MVRLNPKDASVLARIAQYVGLPPERRRQILDETTTAEAREIGAILLGELDLDGPGISPDVKETVEALRSWSNKARQANAARSGAFGNRLKQSHRG